MREATEALKLFCCNNITMTDSAELWSYERHCGLSFCRQDGLSSALLVMRALSLSVYVSAAVSGLAAVAGQVAVGTCQFALIQLYCPMIFWWFRFVLLSLCQHSSCSYACLVVLKSETWCETYSTLQDHIGLVGNFMFVLALVSWNCTISSCSLSTDCLLGIFLLP